MTSDETTDNFWNVWNSFKWPEPKTTEYRCYYTEDGTVDFYTMEDFPGNYICIDREQYVLAHKPARVVDGKLVIIKPQRVSQQLKPHASTGTLCHPHDVCVPVETNGIYWNQQQNEIN